MSKEKFLGRLRDDIMVQVEPLIKDYATMTLIEDCVTKTLGKAYEEGFQEGYTEADNVSEEIVNELLEELHDPYRD